MGQKINLLRYMSSWKNYGGYDGLPKFLISFNLRVFSILFVTFGFIIYIYIHIYIYIYIYIMNQNKCGD